MVMQHSARTGQKIRKTDEELTHGGVLEEGGGRRGWRCGGEKRKRSGCFSVQLFICLFASSGCYVGAPPTRCCLVHLFDGDARTFSISFSPLLLDKHHGSAQCVPSTASPKGTGDTNAYCHPSAPLIGHGKLLGRVLPCPLRVWRKRCKIGEDKGDLHVQLVSIRSS